MKTEAKRAKARVRVIGEEWRIPTNKGVWGNAGSSPIRFHGKATATKSFFAIF